MLVPYICARNFYKNPDDFVPIFHESVMPYCRVLVNGIYWEEKYPRLVTNEQARRLHREGRFPLLAIVAAMHAWFRRCKQWLERCARVWSCWCSATDPLAELAQGPLGLKEKTGAREWQRESRGGDSAANDPMESEKGKSKLGLR